MHTGVEWTMRAGNNSFSSCKLHPRLSGLSLVPLLANCFPGEVRCKRRRPEPDLSNREPAARRLIGFTLKPACRYQRTSFPLLHCGARDFGQRVGQPDLAHRARGRNAETTGCKELSASDADFPAQSFQSEFGTIRFRQSGERVAGGIAFAHAVAGLPTG